MKRKRGRKFWNRRRKGEKTHVLNEDSIYPCLCQLTYERTSCFHLRIINDGIDSNINAGTILMGILAQLTNIVDTIANSSTSSKTGSSNLDSIGTMVDCSYATLKILGRCQ